MKNTLLFLFLLIFTVGKSQNVNNYKYIQVPDKFSDFTANQFQLNYYLKLLLKKNDFTILSENVGSWPEEARNNPCSVLNADLFKEKSFLKNGLSVTFKDCKNKEIGNYKGISKIKEFDRGYQEALRLALAGLGKYLPTADNYSNKQQNAEVVVDSRVDKITENNPQIDTPVTDSKTVIEAVKPIPEDYEKVKEEKNNSTGVQFTNGEYTVVQTQIPDGSYLLKKKSDGSLIAQMWHTSKGGVLKVTVVNSKEKYTTTGFYDPTSLTIDFMENGQMNTVEFKRISE